MVPQIEHELISREYHSLVIGESALKFLSIADIELIHDKHVMGIRSTKNISGLQRQY